MSKALTALFIITVAVSAFAAKFPSKWKKCPKKDNEDCLKESIRDAIFDIKNGSKALNVFPLDPLHFSRMELNQGGKSPVNINLTFYELDLIGSSRIKINRAKADWDNYNINFDFDVLNGPAYLLGDYAITGKVLVLPIRGKGKANITLENLGVDLTLKGKEQIKNGNKYFKVEDGKFVIKSNRVHFRFENLFDGQPELGENMNIFLNENWQEIMNELNGTISAAIGLGIKEVSNTLFQNIPVKEMYEN